MTIKPTPHWPDCGEALYEALKDALDWHVEEHEALGGDARTKLVNSKRFQKLNAALARAERSGDTEAWENWRVAHRTRLGIAREAFLNGEEP